MNRLEFINALGGRLEQLPKEEVQKVLDYYVESINDRMEDGMSEEEVIESFGDLDMLAAEILVEQGYLAPPAAPVPALEPEPGSPDMPPPAGQKKHLPVWAVVLLILGSPIWLSLGVAAAAVGLSVYIVVLALLFSLWCIAISFAAAGYAGLPAAGLRRMPGPGGDRRSAAAGLPGHFRRIRPPAPPPLG